MSAEQIPLLAAGVLLVAFLYSSVGHAGASGYIAVMTLFGLAPEAIERLRAVILVIAGAKLILAR